MEDLSAKELMILSSIQLFMAKPEYIKPEVFGSGCIAKYKNSFYLLSVFHVINYDELNLYMETNWPIDETGVPLIPVSGFVYFDLLKIAQTANGDELLNLIENGGERLDITFAKINKLPDPELLQPKIAIKNVTLDERPKLYLDLDYVSEPGKAETYGFYGKINHKYDGITLKMEPTLKDNLKYFSSSKSFHKFLAPDIITSETDYEGCSGAPILDSEGRLVALACKIAKGTKLIYGFSIQECIKLLEMAIVAKQF